LSRNTNLKSNTNPNPNANSINVYNIHKNERHHERQCATCRMKCRNPPTVSTHIRSSRARSIKIQRRATKLVINLKKIPYKDRLMHLKLPTLKYRRLRGDMIKVFKITHNIYDPQVSPDLRYYPKSNTRGNKYKLLNHTFHSDTRKYSARLSFTGRHGKCIV